jgi:hypothetical protein
VGRFTIDDDHVALLLRLLQGVDSGSETGELGRIVCKGAAIVERLDHRPMRRGFGAQSPPTDGDGGKRGGAKDKALHDSHPRG